MQEVDVFLLFTRPLDEAGLPYMVTGAVASIIYGEPRLTHDVDIVLEVDPRSAAGLAERFPAEQFYCPPVEVVIIESTRSRRGHFNLIHHETGFKADIYLRGEDPLHQWGLERRRRAPLGPSDGLWVAPPEYVIVRKLEYFREGGAQKHIRDIEGMLRVSPEAIDAAAVQEWVGRLGLEQAWALASGRE